MSTDDLPRIGTDLRRRSRLWKKDLKIGTLNVLSWYRPAAAIKTIEQLEHIGMDITAVQEVRWLDTGSQKVGKSVVFYSGNRDQRHEFGTGFVIHSDLVGSIIAFNPVNERICLIRLKGKWYNYSLVSIHAPTEEKDDHVKESFYDLLERVLSTIPKQDMTLILGDFNAKVGREEAFRPTIGRHSLHDHCNDNGLRLVDLASSNNLLIKSTMFEHKNIHKQTWISNDGVTRNQVDHVLIDARHGSNVLDVRSFRGLDADSDHLLVAAKLRIRISAQKNGKAEKSHLWNIDAFKDTNKKEEYQTSLATALESLGSYTSVESKWDTLQRVIIHNTKNIIGVKPRMKKKEWFDRECEDTLRSRNRARQKMIQEPNVQNKEEYKQERTRARKTLRRKKREHENRILENLQTTSTNNRGRTFFREVKNIKNGFKPRSCTIVKNDEGNLVTNEMEVIETWKNYFDNLLNIEMEGERPELIFYTAEPLMSEPTVEETSKAISRLKNNKAPGSDKIPPECLKNGGEALLQHFHALICQIWREEGMPSSWKESVIVPLHKKGDKMCCSNYRGISLINTGYKVLALILLDKITPYVEHQLGDYQCGFRKNRSTIDQIFTIRQLMEKCWEYSKTLHQLFIDFQQAYDSISRVELWNAMAELGIPRKLISMTKVCVEKSYSSVRIGGRVSTPFLINNGLKQGDALSPLLFNIVLEKVVRTANTGILLFRDQGPRLILAFADDIDIVGRTTIDIKEDFFKLENAAKEVGLKINESKTKYMATKRTGQRDRIGQNVTMDTYNFERVEHFKYLGATITANNNMTEEINMRIQSGNRCYFALQKIMKSKIVSRRTKISIYHTIIRPIMTYACETWTMTKQNENRLRIAERKILRSIYGPVKDQNSEQYRIRNNRELENIYRQPDIVKVVKAERLRWAGHIKRENDERVVKLVWEQNPTGRRPLGRPKLRWRDNLSADLRTLNIANAEQLMMDRNQWRKIVKSAKTHPGL